MGRVDLLLTCVPKEPLQVSPFWRSAPRAPRLTHRMAYGWRARTSYSCHRRTFQASESLSTFVWCFLDESLRVYRFFTRFLRHFELVGIIFGVFFWIWSGLLAAHNTMHATFCSSLLSLSWVFSRIFSIFSTTWGFFRTTWPVSTSARLPRASNERLERQFTGSADCADRAGASPAGTESRSLGFRLAVLDPQGDGRRQGWKSKRENLVGER